MAAPMRRQNRIRMARLGSNSPKRLATVMIAGRESQRHEYRDDHSDRERNS